MNITLDSNPSDAPCCLKITADNGADILIQTDWEWPGIAGTFGFSLSSVQRDDFETPCEHSGTDGTVTCAACGLTAHDFIAAARDWLDANDGATAEDPGYFES
jgi:hypothetical protein